MLSAPLSPLHSSSPSCSLYLSLPYSLTPFTPSLLASAPYVSLPSSRVPFYVILVSFSHITSFTPWHSSFTPIPSPPSCTSSVSLLPSLSVSLYSISITLPISFPIHSACHSFIPIYTETLPLFPPFFLSFVFRFFFLPIPFPFLLCYAPLLLRVPFVLQSLSPCHSSLVPLRFALPHLLLVFLILYSLLFLSSPLFHHVLFSFLPITPRLLPPSSFLHFAHPCPLSPFFLPSFLHLSITSFLPPFAS